MITPILNSERLILRPFCVNDVEAVFHGWESDPEVAKYMFWTSHNDINKTREWINFELGQIEKDDWYRFALELKDTKELIGTGLIYYEEEVECWEIGYNLSQKYWGKGYTTEAMKQIISFVKEELGIKEIVGRYAKENPTSGNVMQKLGFQFEKEIPYECNDGAIIREGIQCRFNLVEGVVLEKGEKIYTCLSILQLIMNRRIITGLLQIVCVIHKQKNLKNFFPKNIVG